MDDAFTRATFFCPWTALPPRFFILFFLTIPSSFTLRLPPAASPYLLPLRWPPIRSLTAGWLGFWYIAHRIVCRLCSR
ncbi:hypothetical protein BC826DRAFT_1005063, partial [Russula brevipes]